MCVLVKNLCTYTQGNMDNDASCSIVKTVEKLQTTYTHIYKETEK